MVKKGNACSTQPTDDRCLLMVCHSTHSMHRSLTLADRSYWQLQSSRDQSTVTYLLLLTYAKSYVIPIWGQQGPKHSILSNWPLWLIQLIINWLIISMFISKSVIIHLNFTFLFFLKQMIDFDYNWNDHWWRSNGVLGASHPVIRPIILDCYLNCGPHRFKLAFFAGWLVHAICEDRSSIMKAISHHIDGLLFVQLICIEEKKCLIAIECNDCADSLQWKGKNEAYNSNGGGITTPSTTFGQCRPTLCPNRNRSD